MQHLKLIHNLGFVLKHCSSFQVVECRWGDGVYEDKLDEILKADTSKKIKAVAVVHNETTTGVTSDLKQVREVIDANNHPALFLVDGVSSIGALPFYFDDWKVDVAVTGSQKALSLPTGLALLAVSDKVNVSFLKGE